MSQKELKTQVGQFTPKIRQKEFKVLKSISEKPKEEIFYLPKPIGTVPPFTLVMDLDETLVHYAEVKLTQSILIYSLDSWKSK